MSTQTAAKRQHDNPYRQPLAGVGSKMQAARYRIEKAQAQIEKDRALLEDLEAEQQRLRRDFLLDRVERFLDHCLTSYRDNGHHGDAYAALLASMKADRRAFLRTPEGARAISDASELMDLLDDATLYDSRAVEFARELVAK